jgi:hypothetical protein
MSTHGELSTYEFNKGANACFFIPNKRDKWFFGRLQHNISFSKTDDCVTFLCVEDHKRIFKTFSVKQIGQAVQILNNKIPTHLSEHKKDWLFGGKETLDFFADSIDEEERQGLMAESLALYRARTPAKLVKEPPRPKPPLPKSMYPAPKKTKNETCYPEWPRC